MLGRRPQPFNIRITVIGVQTKHAWVLAPDHLMLTRHLIADLDNALDWLRPRILALAWTQSWPAARRRAVDNSTPLSAGSRTVTKSAPS